MSQLPILVPASNLMKSPTNVRRTSDLVADAQLQANIAEKGIIQNLIGVPVSRKKGHYRITAGGRRLDAVKRLIEAGLLDADYPVPVLALADARKGDPNMSFGCGPACGFGTSATRSLRVRRNDRSTLSADTFF